MRLEELLAEKHSTVIQKWFDSILETYPADTSKFLREQKNQFTNPVGATILTGIESLFRGLLDRSAPEKISPFLDNIIRIRAIQDFLPSQAVSFVFSLKKVIREELADSAVAPADLREFEDRIDELAMLSFDIFMKCREKLYEIKANEMRNMTFRLVQRANSMGEGQDSPESAAGNLDNDNQKRGN